MSDQGMFNKGKKLKGLLERLRDTPKNYPTVTLPIKAKDLRDLYVVLNKKYFKNELPKVPIKMAPLAKNFLGKVHLIWEKETPSARLITIATRIENDSRQLIDTLLHEMIHVWQAVEVAKTGKKDALDFTVRFRGEANERHHGKNFKQHMDRLNKEGFNITITADEPVNLEIKKEFFVVIYSGSGTNVILYHPQDIQPHLDKITAQVLEIVPILDKIVILKTKNASILNATRITKTFNLPKNVVNIRFVSEFADQIMLSKLSKIISNEKLSDPEGSGKISTVGIPENVLKLLPSVRKDYIGASFSEYISIIIHNVSDYRSKKIRKAEELPKNVYDYLRNVWLNIKDIEIRRFIVKELKKFLQSWILEVIRSPKVGTEKFRLTPEFEQRILNFYQTTFAERVESVRFRKLFDEAVPTTLKALGKKFRTFPTNPEELKGMQDIIFGDIRFSARTSESVLLEALDNIFKGE